MPDEPAPEATPPAPTPADTTPATEEHDGNVWGYGQELFTLDLANLEPFIDPPVMLEWLERAHDADLVLQAGSGAGNDFLGWLALPERMEPLVPTILEAAAALRELTETIVVVGIGGSYLGSRAVVEALTWPALGRPGTLGAPELLFAGHQLSSRYHHRLLDYLRDREFGVIMISKSGTTTEPAVAFRFLRTLMTEKYGDGAAHAERIIAITDREKGALRTLADEEGYRSFVVPDDVGGRFSVLSPVGLVPIACAGLSIAELLEGAAHARSDLAARQIDPACMYAATRNMLYADGKRIELLASFEPQLHMLAEWWKQLYGESEGKDGKGLFPAAVDLTTDLHSLGQLIQDGERNLFETFLVSDAMVDTERLAVPRDDRNLDGLNYLCDAGLTLAGINRAAYQGTAEAHTSGGVPNLTIRLHELSPAMIGYLIYFFEKACGISGYLLGVNPFDQPGVDAYKQNMFRILGKP